MAAADPPGTDAPGTHPPGADPPGTHPPGADPPGTHPPGADAPGADPPGTHPPGAEPPRSDLRDATRYLLEELVARAPGHTIEVRVPPYGAVQCVEGPRHTRGTPPGVVETDPLTWVALATGRLQWDEALASGALRASGERADLSAHLPLV
jgi:hypothetical protein